MSHHDPIEIKRVPTGVYLSRQRDTAILFRQAKDGVWFITMRTGSVKVEHLSDERFTREFPLALPAYPLRKAARGYANSLLRVEEKAADVIRILLRDA